MSWFNVWDGLKNKVCRYLLQRYLGQFLDGELNLEKLKIDLYNGKATVKDVTLKVEVLNEILQKQGWAVEVLSGKIGLLTVTVPWNSLTTNDSDIEASDIVLTIRPIKRETFGTSMLESMWSSVSSSIQLAEECMKQNLDGAAKSYETGPNTILGLEKFAETIDNVLNRIKAKIENITIKLECLHNSSQGVSLILKIKESFYKNDTYNMEYQNENNENYYMEEKSPTKKGQMEFQNLPMFAKHNIVLKGITLSTEEFSYKMKSPFDLYETYKLENSCITSRSSLFNKINSLQTPVFEMKTEQIIKLKLKQSEEIDGPKILLDIEFGTLFLVASPRQLHIFSIIMQSFNEEKDMTVLRSTPSTYLSCNLDTSCNQYQRDSQLSYMGGELSNCKGWSDEYAQSDLQKTDNSLIENCTDFQRSSSLTSSVSNATTAYKQSASNATSCGEISNITLKMINFFAVILHEDIVQENEIFNENCEENIEQRYRKIFAAMNQIRDNQGVSLKLANENYFQLQLSRIHITGSQERKVDDLTSKFYLFVTQIHFYEVLERNVISLVTFHREKYFAGNPDITMNVTTSQSSKFKRKTVNLDIKLEKCTIDLDISMYDRISVIIGPSPFVLQCDRTKYPAESPKIKHDCGHQEDASLTITSSKINVKLRFPVANKDTQHNDSTSKCWLKRKVNKDFLLISLHKFKVDQKLCKWDITGTLFEVFYCKDAIESKIILLKSCVDQKCTSHFAQNSNSLLITIIPNQKCNKCGKNKKKLMRPNLPFCSQRTYRQSNVNQTDVQSQDTEYVFLPGDKHEIKNFCEFSKRTSRMQISVNLPCLTVILRSKSLYEIIYNRINFDLMMWEPTSPFYKDKTKTTTNGQEEIKIVNNPSSSIYLSAHNLWTSYTRDHPTIVNMSLKSTINEDIPVDFSACSMEVSVKKGHIILFTPTRRTNGDIINGKYGRFDVKIQDLQIFNVAGFEKNKNLGYLCLQLSDLDLLHCGVVSDISVDVMNIERTEIPDFMQSTLYKTPNGLTKGNSKGTQNREMMSLIIEIRKNEEEKIKRLKLTSLIQMTTFRHRCALTKNNWMSQLANFFDVKDYPISGYEPYSVITETQLHIWDSAVDYRFNDFPYRSVIEFGSFSVNSNIISALKSCNWHIILEECVISIAPYQVANNNSVKNAKLRKTFLKSDDLVPVLDIGVLDMSLRLSEEGALLQCPEVDLRCSINDVHLRTCFDSITALAQLLMHAAKNNSSESFEENTNLPTQSSKSTLPVSYITNDQQEHVNALMAEAIRDTVISDHVASDDIAIPNTKMEIFCFPDETQKHKPKAYFKNIECDDTYTEFRRSSIGQNLNQDNIFPDPIDPEVKSDLGDVQFSSLQLNDENYQLEDEYCFVSHKEEMINYGTDNLNVNADSFRIVDNHFSVPNKNTDKLDAPDNYPVAKARYTLCEMTLTWHLYGGRDFPINKDEHKETSKKIETLQMSEAYQNGIWSTKAANLTKKPKEKLTWKTKGGFERDHEVLVEMQFSKVRFIHEIYPQDFTYAARQVLLVHDVEIRDRVQSSDIKKFLYNPNAKHTRLSENMITVKATHSIANLQKENIQECTLKISLMPMRVHIDQDTLLFLVDFFSLIGQQENKDKEELESIQNNNPPLITVDKVPEHIDSLLSNEQLGTEYSKEDDSCSQPMNRAIFFREVTFSPEVLIRFDYQGRRIELSRGPIAGLIMGLGQLEPCTIRLPKLNYSRGLLGVEKLLSYMCREWLKDIKGNQLSQIIKGIGPTYPFVELFQGIYDLFWLPVEQFQKDGRIIKGFQLGAQSFTARTAIAALELTSRLIYLLQFTAETAFDLVSPGPSIRKHKDGGKEKRRRSNRPKDIREGVNNAYLILKEGINNSANTLIENTVAEHDQKGYTGAVGAVVRQIPQLVVCPAVLATQATTNILGGVKNSFVPEAKLEAAEKWKNINE